MPPIRIIAAVAANGVIGHQGALPWNIEAEYRHYLKTVRNQTVIMGRRSYDIFGSDLTARRAVIVSNTLNTKPGVAIKNSLDQAIEYARCFEEGIYLAGGQGIYEEGLALAHELYISHIHQQYPGDTYFPNIDPQQWLRTKSVPYKEFTYTEYRRV